MKEEESSPSVRTLQGGGVGGKKHSSVPVMAAMEEEVKKLREELARKDAEIEELRKRLEEKVGNLDYLSEKDGLSSYPGLLSLQNDRESGSPSLSPTDTRPPRLEVGGDKNLLKFKIIKTLKTGSHQV